MADKSVYKNEVDFEGTTNLKGTANLETTNLNGTTKCSGASSKFNYISDPIVAAASTTTTLTRAQSGGVVLITPNAALVVLPAVATAGQRFEFVMGGNYATANCTVSTADGVYIGAVVDGAGGNQASNGSSNDVVTFGANAVAGDRFECVSNGTAWYIVNGYTSAADGIAFSG